MPLTLGLQGNERRTPRAGRLRRGGETPAQCRVGGEQDVFVFVILIAVLLVKPTGLLGKQGIEKV